MWFIIYYYYYETVRANQGLAFQRQKRLYDVKAVARDFPKGAWVYRYNLAINRFGT